MSTKFLSERRVIPVYFVLFIATVLFIFSCDGAASFGYIGVCWEVGGGMFMSISCISNYLDKGKVD